MSRAEVEAVAIKFQDLQVSESSQLSPWDLVAVAENTSIFLDFQDGRLRQYQVSWIDTILHRDRFPIQDLCGAAFSPCACTPDIAEITAEPQRISSANWEFQVRIFAIGCTPEVSEISEQSKLLVQEEITQLVEQHGLAARGKSAFRTAFAPVSHLESMGRFRQNDFCHRLLAFFQQHTQRAVLEKLLPKIQAQAGERTISRLLIVVVQSTESM